MAEIARHLGMISIAQQALRLAILQAARSGTAPPVFREAGFRIHSQHEEDGLIHLVFSLIGDVSRKCVELGAGDGIECNTANLILYHRWQGLLCDGNAGRMERARHYYRSHPDARYWPPVMATEWITAGSVNGLFSGHGFSGEIDLLVIDLDGVDYWIWEAITVASPRLVVIEFNHLWGPEAAVTVPYRDDFRGGFTEHGSDYAGASLAAMVKLGRRKGYRLVGTNRIATNAFFLREDIHCEWLPEVDTAACFDHPRAKFGMEKRLPGVRDRKWVQV